ncbi:MAG: signal peptidase II [Clostridia bacterium]|nr:signal peptidase II [Clostridia bacterium]
MLYLILWAAIAAVIVGADQLTKYLVIQHIPEGESIPVIEGVLHWTHIKNDGAIFGWFDDSRWMFMVLSTVGILFMIGMLVYWVKKEPKDKLMQVILTLLISGGIGNMIDRCTLGVVTDFIDFCAFPNLWKWIFNVADCAVTIGGGMMVLWLVLSLIVDIKNRKNTAVAEIEQKSDDADTDTES